MIAADWYGVRRDVQLSPIAQRLGPALDALDDDEVALIEDLVRRLAARRKQAQPSAADLRRQYEELVRPAARPPQARPDVVAIMEDAIAARKKATA